MREVPTETVSYPSPTSEFVLDYKEKNGKPYLNEMLGLPDFLYKDQKKDVDLVDEWAIFEIDRRGLNGKKEAYKEIIGDLSKKLKFPKTLNPVEKVNRLSILLKEATETQRRYKKMGLDLKSLEEIYGA